MLGKQGRPYSQDIRDRIFVLFDGGSGVCRIAEQMMVTPSYVSKVLGRRRSTGETSARPQRGHVKPKLAALFDDLRAEVTQRSDATLNELRAWLMTVHGVSVSIKLMHTTLLDLGMTFKKNPSGRPSRTALMSPLPERNGMKANQR